MEYMLSGILFLVIIVAWNVYRRKREFHLSSMIAAQTSEILATLEGTYNMTPTEASKIINRSELENYSQNEIKDLLYGFRDVLYRDIAYSLSFTENSGRVHCVIVEGRNKLSGVAVYLGWSDGGQARYVFTPETETRYPPTRLGLLVQSKLEGRQAAREMAEFG